MLGRIDLFDFFLKNVEYFFSNRCQTELREEPKNSHRPSERPTTRELLEILCGYEENELKSVELFDLDEKMEFSLILKTESPKNSKFF